MIELNLEGIFSAISEFGAPTVIIGVFIYQYMYSKSNLEKSHKYHMDMHTSQLRKYEEAVSSISGEISALSESIMDHTISSGSLNNEIRVSILEITHAVGMLDKIVQSAQVSCSSIERDMADMRNRRQSVIESVREIRNILQDHKEKVHDNIHELSKSLDTGMGQILVSFYEERGLSKGLFGSISNKTFMIHIYKGVIDVKDLIDENGFDSDDYKKSFVLKVSDIVRRRITESIMQIVSLKYMDKEGISTFADEIEYVSEVSISELENRLPSMLDRAISQKDKNYRRLKQEVASHIYKLYADLSSVVKHRFGLPIE